MNLVLMLLASVQVRILKIKQVSFVARVYDE